MENKTVAFKNSHNRNDIILINSFFAFTISAILVFITGYILSFIPNKLDMELINKTYNLPLYTFYPEKSETYQYIVSSILFPLLFCTFYLLLSKKKLIYNTTRFANIIYPVGFVFTSTLFIWLNVKKPYYFGNFLSDINIFFMLISYLLILTLIILNNGNRKTFKYVSLSIVIVSVFFISLIFITKDYFINLNTIGHFDAYYYPVFEVFHGKTLIVDFNSIYGYYPYLMTIFFKLLGGISIFKFSILISLLVLINSTAISLSIWINTKNKAIAMIGIVATMFYVNLSAIGFNGFYLQFNPHRTLFPSLIILISSLYLNTTNENNKKAYLFAGYVISSFSLFWNLDTGVIIIASWCLFLIFNTLLIHKFKDKKLYINSVKITGFTLLAALSALFSIILITYIRTNRVIGITDIFSAQILFKSTGYFMLPMKLKHPWVVLILIYAFGLVKSLREMSFLKNNNTANNHIRSSLYFFISILGVGLFSYYQGRSHYTVFYSAIWTGLILITLFADEYFCSINEYMKKWKETNNTNKIKITTDIAAFLLLIFILSTYSVSFFKTSFNNIRLLPKKLFNDTQNDIVSKKIDFIKKNNPKNETIDLLIFYSAEYYTFLNLKNPMPICSEVDWFTKEDYNKVIRWLEKTDHKLFIDEAMDEKLMKYIPVEFSSVLKKRFRLVDQTKGIQCIEIRTDPNPYIMTNDIKCYELKN